MTITNALFEDLRRWSRRRRCEDRFHLVGGAVRDLLLGRGVTDVDLVTEESLIEGAESLAADLRARVVRPRHRDDTLRLARRGEHVDLARRAPGGLTADLRRRDFTVNAMALPLAFHDPWRQCCDPLGGRRDLGRRIIRAVRMANLREDPARLLRAFRFAATLGFGIDDETLWAIRKEAGKINEVAAERIAPELMGVFGVTAALPAVSAMIATGVLPALLAGGSPAPHTALACRLLAGPDRMDRRTLKALDAALHRPGRLISDSAFAAWLARTDHRLVLRLAWLCRLHRRVAAFEASREPGAFLARLKIPKRRARRAHRIAEAAAHLDQTTVLSRRRLVTLADRLGTDIVASVLLARPEGRRARRPLGFLFRRLLPRLSGPQPLNGHALVESLRLPPGPALGALLADIRIAYRAGYLSSAAEARARLRFAASSRGARLSKGL